MATAWRLEESPYSDKGKGIRDAASVGVASRMTAKDDVKYNKKIIILYCSKDKLLMTKYTNKPIVNNDCESHAKICHYVAVVDKSDKVIHMVSDVKNDYDSTSGLESEGKEEASVVGCNANNANAGRTLNANNSVANSNDNYAGGFAHNKEKSSEETLTSQPSRLNMKEDHIAMCEYGQLDYESIPFMTDNDTAERDAYNIEGTIWDDLKKANSKRNLKGLRRFYLSTEIAIYAVKRTCEKRDTKAKIYYYTHSEEIAVRLIEDIINDTYFVHGYIEVDLPKLHKTSKDRHAKIYSLYDRCMQNLCLTIIEQKLRRKVIRNNYSNIEKRGILCNDKKFCMMNKIRHATVIYNNLYALNTDIKKFYQNINWKVIIDILFRTIKDKTTRDILYKTFEASKDLPIGSCLSPLIADIIMNDYDYIILKHFKPRFYAAFGDNRLYIGRKDILQKILSFTKKYYRNHYHFILKDDYQLNRVSNGFRFCKTWYYNGFVRIRGELRRRAIRAATKPQSFAGYNGILEKSDSKHLLYLIKNDLRNLKRRYNRKMEVRPFKGREVKFETLIGKKVFITDYKKVDNGKDSQYYYVFQLISLTEGDKEPELLRANNGSFEIKQACKEWEHNNTPLPIKVTIARDGTSYYFEEYHMTNKQACDIIIKNMNINLDELR